MGIWDRLGNVIKSYINDEGEKVFGSRGSASSGRRDPDLDAAYEELDDFLGGKGGREFPDSEKGSGDKKKPGPEGGASQDTDRRSAASPPEEIRRDFAELGLTPEATAEDCKEAYKKLLKVHHPDRHAKHDGNLKKATEKSARLNAAYDRLAEWFRNKA